MSRCVATVLQAATCNNVLPITKPGVRFACPNNRQFDPEKLQNVLPSDDNCCSQVRETTAQFQVDLQQLENSVPCLRGGRLVRLSMSSTSNSTCI
jgi:hypothetical protein